MTEQQKKEFEYLSDKLIEWACKNLHPHAKITITPCSAEIVEGVLYYPNVQHVVD